MPTDAKHASKGTLVSRVPFVWRTNLYYVQAPP